MSARDVWMQLYSTENGAELAEKNQFFKKGYVTVKLRTQHEMGQDFSVEFSFADRLQGTY